MLIVSAMLRRGALRLMAGRVVGGLAGLGSTYLFRSPSRVTSAAGWEGAGLAMRQVRSVLPDPASPRVWYATVWTTQHSLWKSTDGGKSWRVLERGLPEGFVPNVLLIAADDPTSLLAAGAGGIYRSGNGGLTWAEVRVPLPQITALAADPFDPRIVYGGSEVGGNFLSRDGGRTWQPVQGGLPRDHFGNVPGGVRFAVHPREQGVVYAATNGFGRLYKSEDGGGNWRSAAEGLSGRRVHDLAIDAEQPNVLYAASETGVFKTIDGAASWRRLAAAPPVAAVGLVLQRGDDLLAPSTYLAGARGAVFRSTNGGAGWVELAATPRPLRCLKLGQVEGQPALVAAAGEGIWYLRLSPTLPVSPDDPGRNRAYFAHTGHNVGPAFYPYFAAQGGVDRLGYPRTEALVEEGLLVQYFQRARLELRPDLRGTRYEIQPSLLGQQLARVLQVPRQEPAPPFDPDPDHHYFPETEHGVHYAFLRYFWAAGGPDVLGYPLTEEFAEDGRPVQYFQRARLEYLQEFRGTAREVQLGLLGDQTLRRKGWLA